MLCMWNKQNKCLNQQINHQRATINFYMTIDLVIDVKFESDLFAIIG